VTQLRLADLMGADRNTLATWTRQGMPVARRGRGSRGHAYDVGACVRWIRERDRAQHERALAAAKATSQADAARARKWTAEARRAELDVRKREGELVSAAEVERRWTTIGAEARNQLLGLPTRARQGIPHLTAKDTLALDALIREALHALADGHAAPAKEPTP
jgi:phage terminase Nu1 subunit (DNA packaging protein)